MLTKTKVSDWMTREPITISDTASMIEAIHLMKERGVRRLPVLHEGRLCGVLTDRMVKDYSPGKATSLDTWEVHYLLSKTPVREAMNPHPHLTTPDSELTDAAHIIRDNKLYGLCVVNDQGDLVGVLTIKDLIDAFFHIAQEAQAMQGATAVRA